MSTAIDPNDSYIKKLAAEVELKMDALDAIKSKLKTKGAQDHAALRKVLTTAQAKKKVFKSRRRK